MAVHDLELARGVMQMDERGILYHIVRFLWPLGIAATFVGFIMFLRQGLIYEACLQAFTLLMMIYVWPKKEGD